MLWIKVHEHFLWNCSHVNATEKIGDKSALVHVMAWCRRATGHYLADVDKGPWRHVVSLGYVQFITGNSWFNIGSGDGLLPDGTKPSPEPDIDLSSNVLYEQFHTKYS